MVLKDNQILPRKGYFTERVNSARIGIKKYEHADFSPFTDSVRSNLVRYVSLKEWAIENGVGLYLFGPNGTGKTWALSALIKAFAQYGYSCLLIPAEELKPIALGMRGDFDDYETWQERIRNVHVLGIDDIGQEYKGNSGFVETSLGALLRERAQAKNTITLMSSNLSPLPARKGHLSQFEQTYGPSSSSLLLEMMRPLEIRTGQFRQALQKSYKDVLGF